MKSLIDFSSSAFYDKVYGCWMGKNCGGTLGAPLEKSIGEPDPFDTWWYPTLQEGGIPNDDLELQLIWLKAFEERGRDLNAHHLAQYWLNNVAYNMDEYGWARMNLRLGLLPPLSGSYNNWFKDCMGCPIRSEIFACVAPGLPRLAAQYAYQDAIVDHAGGESVYGELFNTAIASSAFIVSDLKELLDIGRTYVPEGSKTAQAIDAARRAHAAGLDWKAARRKVLEATPHYNAQYSPINMGFQTIGLLYGKDFAESLCIAVNCGYDTDCTGATVGATLGIIYGNSGLPEKWTEPLGDVIATNESWGGLRYCSDGLFPIPKNLKELTLRTIEVARIVSAGHTPSRDALCADDSVRALWRLPVTRVSFALGTINADIEYGENPVGVPGTRKPIQTILTNTAPTPLSVRCSISTPSGWKAPADQTVDIPGRGQCVVEWMLEIPESTVLENSNTLFLQVSAPRQVAQLSAPITLIGSRRLRISGPYSLAGATQSDLLDHAFAPEKSTGDFLRLDARSGSWSIHPVIGHDLELAGHLPAGQAIYVQAFIESESERKVILGLPTTGSVKSWVNGECVHNLLDVERFRPHAHKTQPYIEVTLKRGYNEILAKLVRRVDSDSFDAHLIWADPSDINAGIVDLRWTRLPDQ